MGHAVLFGFKSACFCVDCRCCTRSVNVRLFRQTVPPPSLCAPSCGTQSRFHLVAPRVPGATFQCRRRAVTALLLWPHASRTDHIRTPPARSPFSELGSLRMLEAHSCSIPGHCETCFAGCFIKKRRTRKGLKETVWATPTSEMG